MMQKDHAVIVYDVKDAIDSIGHLATNLSALCSPAGFTNTGSSAVSILRQLAPAGLQKVGGTHIVMRDVTIGGVPGLETTNTISSAQGTLYYGQLEVAPKPGRVCVITLTGTQGNFPASTLAVAAATARFSG